MAISTRAFHYELATQRNTITSHHSTVPELFYTSRQSRVQLRKFMQSWYNMIHGW
jgi:hypothetical protein